eukprot:scaffold45412_cov46-Prasinocladus_malaysianus.AAC.1
MQSEESIPPAFPVEPEELHVFSHFQHTCWQLCDRARLQDGVTLSQIVNWGNSADQPAQPVAPVEGVGVSVEDQKATTGADSASHARAPESPAVAEPVAAGTSMSATASSRRSNDVRPA